MKKKLNEFQATLITLGRELAEIRDHLKEQSSLSAELESQIGRLEEIISNQQGYLNQQVAENSTMINQLISVTHFGSQEIYHYVQLLREVRDSEKYSTVFSLEKPKISVIIPTHSNPRSLWERTMPSITSQTFENLEILIVVDGNNSEILSNTMDAALMFGDSRISVHLAPPTPTEFTEIAHWPAERKQQFEWFRSGNGPFNYGLDVATGDWIAPFSHDDAMHLDGYERVLEKAIQMKWEYCYAPINRLSPSESSIIHSFPPRSHNFGVQGSLMHSSLKMFRYDYRDALVGLPNDYGMVRRMMLCGVRMGTIDKAASDYYPNTLWT